MKKVEITQLLFNNLIPVSRLQIEAQINLN